MRIGVPELILILIIVIVVLGPTHLPRLGRALGQTVRAFRQGRGMDAAAAPSLEDKGEETAVGTGTEGTGAVNRVVTSCLRLARRLLKRGGAA